MVGDVELEEGPAKRQEPQETTDRAAGRPGLAFALAEFGQSFEVNGFAGRLVTIRGGIHGRVCLMGCTMRIFIG